jgi:hypothetical protein
MPKIPNCASLGNQCREVKVTIRVSDVESETRTLQDASMTWITGHTERITFGEPYVVDTDLRVDAKIHVPCRYLRAEDGSRAIRPDGRRGKGMSGKGVKAVCSAHGYCGKLPKSSRKPGQVPQVNLGNGLFSVIFKKKRRELELRLKRAAKKKKKKKQLPVLQSDNPCIGAPCITGDGKRGAACCRDLQLELYLPKKRRKKEALLRARRSPYLCKVKREDKDTVGCEVISACGYLEDDGIHCVLHDRILPNGRRAKPSLCYEWPELGPDETGHTGCRLI